MQWGKEIRGSVGLEGHCGRYCVHRFDVGLVLYEGLGTVWVPQEISMKKLWKLFKFYGPCIWYKVGLCICTGKIVWTHGPFPCGQWCDISVFWHALIHELNKGEKVEADLGDRGEPRHVNEANIFQTSQEQNQKSLVQSWHETNYQDV